MFPAVEAEELSTARLTLRAPTGNAVAPPSEGSENELGVPVAVNLATSWLTPT